MTSGRPDASGRTEASSARLVGTLAGAGAMAGLALVLVFGWAQPRILAHQARALSDAVEEVLGEPERYETLYVVDGRLTPDLPPGADSVATDRVFLGYDASGRPLGFAIVGAKPGFQDVIRLIFGYDPVGDRVLGMKVLESKETPGLGDKIEKDSAFVAEFEGVESPLRGVKPGAGTGARNDVDMITGATISSRTIIDIINARLELLGPVLDAYAPAEEAQ